MGMPYSSAVWISRLMCRLASAEESNRSTRASEARIAETIASSHAAPGGMLRGAYHASIPWRCRYLATCSTVSLRLLW